MQKVKTLFIFTFMVVILYGAYHVLYSEPAPPPQEVIDAVAEGGADPLDVGLGTEISAEQLLADLNNGTPLAEDDSNLTAADNGQFQSPAAGQLDLGVTQESPEENLLADQTTEEDTSGNTLADSVGSEAENVAANDTFPAEGTVGGDFQPVGGEDAFPIGEAGGVDDDMFPIGEPPMETNSFQVNDQNPSSQLQPPVLNDGNLSSANNVTEQRPLSTSSAFATVWAAAKQQIETGHLHEALQALSAYYGSTELTAQQHKQLVPMLDFLAGEVVYSRKHYIYKAYTVGPTDSLGSIAHQLRVPAQLLANINGIRDAAALKPGDELKIVQGPFRGEVHVANRELTLFVGPLYAGRFQVELGSEFKMQPGQYSVLEKQEDRSYYAADGSIIQGGAVNNPYGKYWMDLGGISIHTQSQNAGVRNAGLGCIKLSPVNARDVYHILGAGSQVMIR